MEWQWVMMRLENWWKSKKMRKFAIKITKGDDIKIIGTYSTKEEALKNGELIYNQLPATSVTVSCISADFDVDGNMVGNKYKLYETWI